MTQPAENPEHQGPTVHDRRRIDPDTYEVRDSGNASPTPEELLEEVEVELGGADSGESSERVAQLEKELGERTQDLQRLQAEYVNYKRRVDRDRDVAKQAGVEGVLMDLLPILDDLQAAREHEELTGGFKAVADEIANTAAKYGVVAYGKKGDPFDPVIHEALLHSHQEGLEGPTCLEVLQVGYMWKDRKLRAARVAVGEPPAGGAPAAGADGSDTAQ